MLKRLGQIELAICVVLLAIITGLVFVASSCASSAPAGVVGGLGAALFSGCASRRGQGNAREAHLGMEVPISISPTSTTLVELVCR